MAARMLTRIAVSLLLLCVGISGQTKSDRAEVERMVKDYVGLYTATTLEQWRTLFHPELRVSHPSEDGTIRVRNVDQFFNSQKQGFVEDPKMHEELDNVEIFMARRMARVNADYVFTSGGKPSHGKLGLHLVRGKKGWKIVGIVFSYDDEEDCGASCTQPSGAQKNPETKQ
jgi:hypothetical protein